MLPFQLKVFVLFLCPASATSLETKLLYHAACSKVGLVPLNTGDIFATRYADWWEGSSPVCLPI
jgi:hypothetical protein